MRLPMFVLAWIVAHVGAAHTAETASPELLATPPGWLGAPSCSARACHGETALQRSHPAIWGFEHTIWKQFDKHHRAYAVLLEPRSQQMAARLKLDQPAHRAQVCLACHAPAAAEHTLTTNPGECVPSYVTEGIGCEACHGPAQRWIAAHTGADWALLSPLEKEQAYGFKNTKDLVVRAELCVGCHVGGPGRDVNHDLIAAGHPRLTFEFSSYLRRMPPHWDEKAENDRTLQPALEARAWSIGQISAARAQLELLANRAEAAADDRPGAVWPEFAEYSCYACHRELGPGTTSGAVASLGRPAWGTWNYPLLPLVDHKPATIDREMEAVARLMSSLTADEQSAAEAARKAARELDGWLTSASTATYDLRHIEQQQRKLAERGLSLSAGEWDVAAQLYLALAAWQQSRLDVQRRATPEDAAVRRLLGEARGALLAPSQINRDPAAFARRMEELQQKLTR